MNKQKKILVLIVIITAAVYLGIKSVRSSIVLKGFDRLNVVIYSQTPVFYSLALNNISYFIPFQADYEMLIPGGYGQYRLGALGKLVYLEKKPEIIKRAFSAATSSFVDIYFYPRSTTIYYGSNFHPSVFPSPFAIFLSQSNASWLDRVILFYMFSYRNKNQYKLIEDLPIEKTGNVLSFDRDAFFKKYQGFLYEKSFRELNDTIQIKYAKNYKTAQLISQILEGEGIRVVDISEEGGDDLNTCIVLQKEKPDITVLSMAKHLGCSGEKGSTDISDIILSLGSLEEEWSVE